MSTFDVSRSARIDASPAQVHALVRDFKSWPRWSPWLIADPHARLTFADDGKRYDWDGPICGSGFLEIVDDQAPGSIELSLTFLKPWKSTNSVGFQFVEKDGGTEVTWTMNGMLPWFLFWMTTRMAGYISADYDRGLSMLKALVETGEVPSKLEFPGVAEIPSTAYVGINTACPITEIGCHMEKDFARLHEWLGESGLTPSSAPFSSVSSWAPDKDLCRYTVCIPFFEAPAEAPAGFVGGTRPACRAYQVRHTGPYQHLGNAWAAGMMHAQNKVFDASKRLAPFEIYESDPQSTPEIELVTVIHIPAK